jgi:hypothetical protein
MATGRVPTTANSPLTAKGDLFGYSTTQARVPVGNDGETIVANSSTSTGLAWAGNYAAGKNKIINGDFGVWQRGTSFTITGQAYLVDRWLWTGGGSGATRTLTQQTFTPGTAPVAGYEGTFFARYNQSVAGTGSTYNQFMTRLEDVRLFAGQTATVSFWAKADATRSVDLIFGQNFGSGGSGSTETSFSPSSVTLTTSWARYTATVTVPSVSGKTIGTGSYAFFYFGMPNNTVFTIDYWGVQLEAGSVATAFQTATGTIQGELAACQRYYYRLNGITAANPGSGFADATTVGIIAGSFPVAMRIAPTALEQSGTATDYAIRHGNSTVTTCSAVPIYGQTTTNTYGSSFSVASGLTTGQGLFGRFANSNAYLGWSAEL